MCLRELGRRQRLVATKIWRVFYNKFFDFLVVVDNWLDQQSHDVEGRGSRPLVGS